MQERVETPTATLINDGLSQHVQGTVPHRCQAPRLARGQRQSHQHHRRLYGHCWSAACSAASTALVGSICGAMWTNPVTVTAYVIQAHSRLSTQHLTTD